MDTWLQESGWALPESIEFVRFLSRLVFAAVFGACIGLEREWQGMEAGLRTHMLVALGSALFVVIPLEAGGTTEDLSHVIKGITSGIGFIGAGAILKLAAEREIKGLTTAASIWLTAAVGVAAGGGQMWPALASVVMALIILAVLDKIEQRYVKPIVASKGKDRTSEEE
jgi:putative Mg2+ transporter-C (MgtC) family protein